MMFAVRAAALWTAAALLSVLSGCAEQPKPQGLSLRPVSFGEMPDWSQDHVGEILPPLLAQCVRLARLPVDMRLGGQAGAADAAGRAGLWQSACRAAQLLPAGSDAAVRHYLETWFLPYEVRDGDSAEARLTGYFEPEFPGALGPSADDPVPVYGRPLDLVTVASTIPGGKPVTGRAQAGQVVPYWTRAQIDAGTLHGRNLEILWLHSPIDLFFLQVQGSGRIRLPSGQIVRLGYDGRNGQPYVPLGRKLVEQGQLPAGGVSMQSIRDWLTTHPAQAQAMMEQNPNYVFFRILDDFAPDQGPPGALGVALTPLRSVAIDRSVLPLGVPVFVETTRPDGTPLDRLMLAQDLGTDINGPTRADLFFGWGDAAARDAGAMQAGGRMVVLLPRQPATP